MTLPEITADELNIWLRREFDTKNREFTLEDWDKTVDGPLPPLNWDKRPQPLDGSLLQVPSMQQDLVPQMKQ